MKKILFATIGLFIFLIGCDDVDIYEKYGPEIMYYQYEDEGVATSEFNSITLDAVTTEYTVMARVSAPFKLKEIKVYRGETVVQTVTDFSHEPKPTEYFLKQPLADMTATTLVRIEAKDMDDKLTVKTFTIKK